MALQGLHEALGDGRVLADLLYVSTASHELLNQVGELRVHNLCRDIERKHAEVCVRLGQPCREQNNRDPVCSAGLQLLHTVVPVHDPVGPIFVLHDSDEVLKGTK